MIMCLTILFKAFFVVYDWKMIWPFQYNDFND